MIIGGAQENTLLTCAGHLKKGHQVTLVTGETTGPEGKLLDKFCPEGLEVIVVPELVRELSPLNDWKAYRALYKLFTKRSFDVVHTHASKAGILGRMAAWKAKVPFVVHTVHGQAFHPYQSKWKNQIYIAAERFAARRCHKIYAVAQAMIDQCVNAGVAPREKYQVVYSGMDLSAFMEQKPEQALKDRLGIGPDELVVGKIARLFELKGHDCLLKAAPLILKECPNTKFLLVGDGILRENLQNMAKSLGVADHVIFAGLIPPGEVCRYTALMDVLAHLSLREGLPRTAVQGLASGIPVVAYPLDGTPEVVIENQTGFLCPPEDVNCIAERIITLLKDRQLREKLGRNGQNLVREKFAWERMADILEQEYLNGIA